jgi:hypothetical protein
VAAHFFSPSRRACFPQRSNEFHSRGQKLLLWAVRSTALLKQSLIWRAGRDRNTTKAMMLRAAEERAGFSLRLGASLNDVGWITLSPTRLALEFNLRAGASAITLHAARKWIGSQAIPTQLRIVLLANWLQVSADWLRFGGTTETRLQTRFAQQDLIVLAAVSLLNSARKKPVREMIEILVRADRRSPILQRG